VRASAASGRGKFPGGGWERGSHAASRGLGVSEAKAGSEVGELAGEGLAGGAGIGVHPSRDRGDAGGGGDGGVRCVRGAQGPARARGQWGPRALMVVGGEGMPCVDSGSCVPK